jgi:hypothetical protein
MGNIDVCTESELLEVKVPIVFLATVGFSPPRDGRYYSFESPFPVAMFQALPASALESNDHSVNRWLRLEKHFIL